jgi:hypothetical protein
MGAFAEWQPRYAEHGIATFPVEIMDDGRKKPAVGGYLKLGAKYSSQLTLKFGEHEAIGLACFRNKITVLDVDTPDERVLADALSRHGHTPFIVRSGSGNWQAWYRNSGEGRRIRPDPSKPIDILGHGYVVAPPSKARRGYYQLVQGSMDDLDRLPRMVKQAANDLGEKLAVEAVQASMDDLETSRRGTFGKIREGSRNDNLWRYCMKVIRGCAKVEDLMEKAMEYNRETFYEPLPDAEVLKVVASAMVYEREGKNWFGHGARVVVDHDVVDNLASSEPHAFALLSILKRHHWGREFALAKAFAESLGWTLRSFKEARSILVQRGLIECVHLGGKGPKDPPIYRFSKGYENAPQ